MKTKTRPIGRVFVTRIGISLVANDEWLYTISMSWAARRRLFILLILGAFIAAILAVIGFATFYHVPSCADGIQNQGEAGIDCGGPCANLCTNLEQAPAVLYTKPISNGAGRTDVIAEVANKNPDAASKRVPFTISLFDGTHTLVQSVSGVLDLPPNATVPVFVPGVASGSRVVTEAFLSVASSSVSWYRMSADTRIVPVVSNITQGGTTNDPVIEATLTNPSATVLSQVPVVVIVHDASGNVIAASKTIVPRIAEQGTATATFTWNGPFSVPAASIEVLPVIALP